MNIVSFPYYPGTPSSPGEQPGKNNLERLEAVSEQFEALFLQQILKQMRKAGDALTADDSMRSRELETMHDFHDAALAEALARKRQTGLADMLVRQLGGAVQASEQAAGNQPELLPRNELAGWQREAANHPAGRIGALIESVIRHESGGDPAAVSAKGARGLMQLMPGTAREMAAELGLDYDEARLTEDAGYNRRLGTAYLHKLLERYDGEPALALAAYNAGPGKVDEWLQRFGDPRTGAVDVAAWVEQIPYRETREYTRSILRDLPGSTAQLQPAVERAPLKSAAEPVALQENKLNSGPLHRSAAFAQPIRIETKETLS